MVLEQELGPSAKTECPDQWTAAWLRAGAGIS